MDSSLLRDRAQLSLEIVGHVKSLKVDFNNEAPDSALGADPRCILSLPAEVLFKVFSLLSLHDLCSCRCVSRKWCYFTNEYFRHIQTLNIVPFQPLMTAYGLKLVLRYVHNLRVVRLETCWKCVNEENLLIIAINCPKLRVLTLSRCKGVTDKCLKALARNCQQIEELDLSSCFQVPYLSSSDLAHPWNIWIIMSAAIWNQRSFHSNSVLVVLLNYSWWNSQNIRQVFNDLGKLILEKSQHC